MSTKLWARQKGFTIVELLIVIVVIAILAAISVVAYNGIQDRANDSAVQSNLKDLSKKIELYKIDETSGRYPYGSQYDAAVNGTDKMNMPITTSAYSASVSYNLLNCTNNASPGSDYAMLAISKSGKKYWISSLNSSVQEYTGAVVWGEVTACPSMLAGSTGNGAGYASAAWRVWTASS